MAGHIGQAINSLKNNKALKSKSNKFRKARFNQEIAWETKFVFKTPTSEELQKSQLSNQKFKQQQRKRNLGILVVAVVAALLTMYFLVGMLGEINPRPIY